jgi:hypothetical protein
MRRYQLRRFELRQMRESLPRARAMLRRRVRVLPNWGECVSGVPLCRCPPFSKSTCLILRTPVCVDLTSNSQACGNCSTACADFQTCCNGVCTNRQSDPANCGHCNGTCSDFNNDKANCGGCGHACKPGQHCAKGVMRGKNIAALSPRTALRLMCLPTRPGVRHGSGRKILRTAPLGDSQLQLPPARLCSCHAAATPPGRNRALVVPSRQTEIDG